MHIYICIYIHICIYVYMYVFRPSWERIDTYDGNLIGG